MKILLSGCVTVVRSVHCFEPVVVVVAVVVVVVVVSSHTIRNVVINRIKQFSF
jgi:hypothetical protein